MARQADPNLAPRLYEAALEVFAAHGLTEARVEDITERAGTSKGAFYLCFASKEALFVAIADDFDRAMHVELQAINAELRNAVPRTPDGLTAECAAAVAAADTRFVDFLRQRRREVSVVLHSARAPTTAHLFERFLGAWMAHFEGMVRSHQEMMPTELLQLDAAFVARLATGLLFMLARDAAAGSLDGAVALQLTRFRLMLVAGQLTLLGLPPEVASQLGVLCPVGTSAGAMDWSGGASRSPGVKE